MEQEQERHEPETQDDAFNLSDDDFRDKIANAGVEDNEVDTSSQDEQSAEPVAEDNTQTTETVETGNDNPVEEPAQEEPQPDDNMVKIIHRGQEHRITKEKAVELAQKGFDYDVKVGPHQRLVQLVEADPGAAQALNEYVQNKIKPKAPEPAKEFQVKPLAEYDSDEKWLADNLNEFKKVATPPQQQAPQQNPVADIQRALIARDPDNFNSVVPKLEEYAQRLSVQDYNRVNSDFGSLCKFYDHVKADLIKPKQQAPKQAVTPKTNTPSFKVKSGGGEPSRSGDKNPWELSNKDFANVLAQVKGY